MTMTMTPQKTNEQRLDCVMCDHHIDPKDGRLLAKFPCSIRAFRDESFRVWRCPSCRTIHCLDIVDLDHYYAQYPVAQAQLTWPYRFIYRYQLRFLTRNGFSKEHKLLDYGCGANGLFIEYLKEQGYTRVYGYDPYGPKDGFGNPDILEHGPFDYIVNQDVIEHVENPHKLLNKLNSLLSPEGHILVGTPNAANIDLNQPNLPDTYHFIHVPYHLHIYTPESLKSLGRAQGWEPVDFIDRGYDDTPWFGFNVRAWNIYTNLLDGSLDLVFEPLKLGKALTSFKFLFYAIFGYWLSFHSRMAVVFRKSEQPHL